MAEKRQFENTKEAKLTKKPKIVYTAEEEDWLVKNVLAYRAIIENKKTDGATNRNKDKAWAKVTNAFNIAPPGKERTQQSLREKYQKIKQTLKDRALYFSKDAKQTGGGPPKKELRPLSEPMEQLAVLLNRSSLGLVAMAGDSDYSTANQSALQNASPELATSQDEAVTVEEIDIVDGSQHHLEAKNRIEIEILECERDRYKFERERADLDRKRAAFELERAELDRDRSAIELERSKIKLLYDKELHRLTLQPTSDDIQSARTSLTIASVKEEYN